MAIACVCLCVWADKRLVSSAANLHLAQSVIPFPLPPLLLLFLPSIRSRALRMDDELARRIAELEVAGQELDGLVGIELWWRDHQEWLAEKGYLLRPRYKPGWNPSWAGRLKKYQYPEDFEDSHKPNVRRCS